MQRSRRRDPYPFTWEVPVGVAVVVGSVLVGGVQLGRAVANVLSGHGWAWPARAELIRSLPGVLAGDAAAGLPGLPGAAGSATSAGMVYGCLAATGLVLASVAVWLVWVGLRRWGPGRVRGMASPGEASRLLGVGRLWTARTVVRPDLYGADRSR